ncbi:UBP-type zinc finger domain-containing protein [Kitasatospora sp. NPDC057223]|uniref:UBP-type zinc finger domain-containing protein n=1 Tax=Kitasatospora sp. NPDC057223 TaxID=3346055 RepID=UPI00363434C1
MSACEDLAAAPRDIVPLPPTDGCADCLAAGRRDWVHLRICLDCGHIGCCDNSPQRHASAHFHNSSHPVIRSYEPGEEWRWCYVHEAMD